MIGSSLGALRGALKTNSVNDVTLLAQLPLARFIRVVTIIEAWYSLMHGCLLLSLLHTQVRMWYATLRSALSCCALAAVQAAVEKGWPGYSRPQCHSNTLLIICRALLRAVALGAVMAILKGSTRSLGTWIRAPDVLLMCMMCWLPGPNSLPSRQNCTHGGVSDGQSPGAPAKAHSCPAV